MECEHAGPPAGRMIVKVHILQGFFGFSGIRFTLPLGKAITMDAAAAQPVACRPLADRDPTKKLRDMIQEPGRRDREFRETSRRGNAAPAKDEGVGEHVGIRFHEADSANEIANR